MTEAEAKVKAGEIIGVHHEQGFAYVACGDGTNYLLDFGDKHERISTFVRKVREAISAALLAASRPGEGMIRTHEGKDLRLLGTLPVTADGCVAGIDAEVWTRPWGGAPEKNHVRTEVPGNPWCGSIPALHCFSTREAASAAKGVGDE